MSRNEDVYNDDFEEAESLYDFFQGRDIAEDKKDALSSFDKCYKLLIALKRVIEIYKQHQQGTSSISAKLYDQGKKAGFVKKVYNEEVAEYTLQNVQNTLKKQKSVKDSSWDLHKYSKELDKLIGFFINMAESYVGTERLSLTDKEIKQFKSDYISNPEDETLDSLNPYKLTSLLHTVYANYDIRENVLHGDNDKLQFVDVTLQTQFEENINVFNNIPTDVPFAIIFIVFRCYEVCVKHLIFQDLQHRLFSKIAWDDDIEEAISGIKYVKDRHAMNGFLPDIIKCNLVFLTILRASYNKQKSPQIHPPAPIANAALKFSLQMPLEKPSISESIADGPSEDIYKLKKQNILLLFDNTNNPDIDKTRSYILNDISRYHEKKGLPKDSVMFLDVDVVDKDHKAVRRLVSTCVTQNVVLINIGYMMHGSGKENTCDALLELLARLQSITVNSVMEVRANDCFQVMTESLSGLSDYVIDHTPSPIPPKIEMFQVIKRILHEKNRNGHVFVKFTIDGKYTLVLLDFYDIRDVVEEKNILCSQLITDCQACTKQDTQDNYTSVIRNISPYDYLNYMFKNGAKIRYAMPAPNDVISKPVNQWTLEDHKQYKLHINKHYEKHNSFARITQALYNTECINLLISFIFNLEFHEPKNPQDFKLANISATFDGKSLLTKTKNLDASKDFGFKHNNLTCSELFKNVVNYKEQCISLINKILDNITKIEGASRRPTVMWDIFDRIQSVYLCQNNFMDQCDTLLNFTKEISNKFQEWVDKPHRIPRNKILLDLIKGSLKELHTINKMLHVINLQLQSGQRKSMNNINMLRVLAKMTNNDQSVKYVVVGNFSTVNEYVNRNKLPVYNGSKWYL